VKQSWPPLPLDAWRDTRDTLQMWTQMVGKICLALTPRVNHFWNVAFQITSRGLMTPALPCEGRTFTMTFDFLEHALVVDRSDGARQTVPFRAETVADFYARLMETLHRMDIDVRIWTMPVEVPEPIRFEKDTVHRSYDGAAARTFWETLLAMKPVFDAFRSEFIGKCSPVHFFWGSFDLAVTRFSGRPAPAREGADSITREAYSHEVISHGWWPGGGAVNEPAFYAYAAPEPPGLKTAPVLPAAAYYTTEMSLLILPYDAVRTSATPEADLQTFLRTTYEAAATLAAWDRKSLERPASTTATAPRHTP
jgi:hypothetical protein